MESGENVGGDRRGSYYAAKPMLKTEVEPNSCSATINLSGLAS